MDQLPSIPSSWAAVAGGAILLAVVYVLAKMRAKAEKESKRALYRSQRARALQERRLDDAAYWEGRLEKLGAVAVIIASLALNGCTTAKPGGPVVIGQRTLMPNPGDVITVPPLIEPAQTWYLIDDVALDRLGFDGGE